MRAQLIEGLADAGGFLAGALLAFAIARAFGLDPFQEGYGPGALTGILVAGVGGGLGVQAARWLLRRRRQDP